MQERDANPDTEGTGPHIWLFALVMTVVALVAAFELMDPGVCHFPEAGSGFQPATCFEYWLNRYQTLLGGLFAIGAAIIGFVAVRHQTTQAERLEDARRRRQALAAVAVLPLALDRLAFYVKQCVEALIKLSEDTVVVEAKGHGRQPSLRPPDLPDGIIDPLKAAVEFLPEDDAVEVRQLISELQIFRARIGGTRHWGVEAEDRLIDAAILHALVARLFSFSRSGLRSKPLRTSMIDRSLFDLQIFDSPFPHMEARLKLIREHEFLKQSLRPPHKWN